MNNKEWFKSAKFGMMVHFGLYSVLAGEYKGKRMTTNEKKYNLLGEWAQSYFRIPNKEYKKLMNARILFRPMTMIL